MNIFNPASFFYFSSCLRIDDREAEVCYSILETLTRENSTAEEVLIAIKNIVLCDAPFQIYSFSFVLGRLDMLDKFHPDVRQTLKDFTGLFISIFNEKSQALAAEIFNEIAGVPQANRLPDRLIEFADLVNSARDGSSYDDLGLPYVDIVEFAAEAVTLALINHFCQNQEITNHLANYLEEGLNSNFSQVIATSYNHKRGRICFIVSIELKGKLGMLGAKEHFGEHIFNNSQVSGAPDLEPDLVFLLLEHWFILFDKNNNEKEKLTNILSELAGLNIYHKLLIHFDTERRCDEYIHADYVKYLEILFGKELNPKTTAYERRSISINIWIGSVYLLINEYFEGSAAHEVLTLLWQPIRMNDDGISFHTGSGLINDKIAPIINSKSGGRAGNDNENNLKIFSPWLTLNAAIKFPRIYFEIDSFSNWLRILYAIKVSKSQLIRFPPDGNKSHAYFLIHVSELLFYQRWLLESDINPPKEKNENGQRLFSTFQRKPHLRKLLLFLNRDVNVLVGRGNIPKIGHSYFFSLIEDNYEKDWFGYFHKEIIPKTLFWWIYNSLQSTAIDKKLIAEQVNYIRLGDRVNTANRIKIKVLRKFLFDEEILDMGDCQDEQDKILLVSPLDINNIEVRDTAPEKILWARAIQRCLFCLITEADLAEAYLNDLTLLIKSVRNNNEISYLNRFALVSLFNEFEKINEQNLYVFKLSIELLFDIDGLLDISLLGNKIINKLISLDDYIFNDAQLEVLNCFSSSVSTSLNYNIHERINTDKPADPNRNIRQNRKIAYLREALNAIQFIVCKFKGQLGGKVRVRNTTSRSNDAFKVFSTDVSVRGKVSNFYLPKEFCRSSTQELSLITYNSVEQTAQFYIKEVSIPEDTRNLFELTRVQRDDLLCSATEAIMVIAKCVEKSRTDHQVKYGFQIHKERTDYLFLQRLDIKVGDWVRLRLFFSTNKQKHLIDSNEIKLITGDSNGTTSVPIHRIEDVKNLNLPLNFWLPCHADIFSGYLQSQIGDDGIKLLVGKNKKPHYNYFNRLLSTLKDINDRVVLTFIGEEWDADRQEYGYLFYERLGWYYLIFESEITCPVADSGTFLEFMFDQAEDEDEDISSLNGLLISFHLSFSDSRIRLALDFSDSRIAPDYHSRFPMLQTPFDKRNIRWRTLFDDCDDIEFTAKNVNGEWLYEVDKNWTELGFRNTISVNLDRQTGNQREVDFLLKRGWVDEGRFRYFISGTVIERFTIERPQLQNYLRLSEGQKVQIKTPLQFSKKSGAFPCFTKQNFKVTINLEELTLIPLNKEVQNIDQTLFQQNFLISVITPWREIKNKRDVSAELIISNFPADKLKHKNEITGYFTDVPKKKDQGVGSCSILLEENGELMTEKIEISVSNLSDDDIQRGLSVYSKLAGSYVNGRWQFFLLIRQIYVKSTRKLIKLEDPDLNNYYFIGEGNINGEKQYLFENENDHGTLFYKSAVVEGTIKNDLYTNLYEIEMNWNSQSLTGWGQRIAFIKENRMITGIMGARINLQQNQILFLKKITYSLQGVNDQEFMLKRTFIMGVSEVQQQKTKISQTQPLERENEKRLKTFRDYFASPIELFGTLDKKQLIITISALSELRWVFENGGWVNKISLYEGEKEKIENLVFVPTAISNYNLKDVSFWLFQNKEGRVFGTFKLGYQTLDDLFAKYDSKLEDVIDIGNKKLYLCDKENIHPYTKESHDEPMYRFEEGFGKNILIPASRLLYDGKPVATSGLVFYKGDSIKKICFTIDRVDDLAVVKLNIKLIEISQAHRLYRQAKEHKIYHLAYLGYSDKKVYIKYVKGLDERAIQKNSMTFNYEKIYASFDDLSMTILSDRFANDTENAEKVVLVKVDTKLFEKTGELQFNHHKLTYIEDEQNPEMRVLKSAARIIATLGKIDITRLRNDYFISVSPCQLLDKVDVGRDFSDGRVLRREFSLNEGLLREYYRRRDFAYFDGFEVFITVAPKKTNKNQVTFSLVNNSVFREQTVLYGFKSVIGISRYTSSTTGSLEIEIKPGNFLTLENSKLRFTSINSIQKGDILDISIIDNNYFEIESAIAGDYRFLENKRKVVVLPKDSVFNLSMANTGRSSLQYTIGGLPNIELDLLDLDANNRNMFLTNHHPKIAAVFKNMAQGRESIFLKIKSQDESSTFGYIEIDEANKELKFISTEFEKKLELKLSWNSVSFYNASANELIARIKKCRWQYHDENSMNLIKRGDEFHVTDPYSIAPSSACNTNASKFVKGPLFCERIQEKVNLRFQKNDLTFWSFPVSSLIDFLDYNREAYAFAYAGKKNNIHFIEIAPGRIVELPVNLLVFKSNNLEISMKDYAWNFLCPGDMVILRNISDDLSDLYKIELLSIRHGFRNVLGKFSKLPVRAINDKTGLVEIGTDNCNLKLPVSPGGANFDISRPVEFFNDGNRILPQGKILEPGNGDTVLVTLSNENFFCILGFQNSNVTYIDFESRARVKELIVACGGAVPAIIVKEEGKRLIQFTLPTFKHLAKSLDGKVVSGIIIGALNGDFKEIVVKIGGYFEVLPFDEVLPGVPKVNRKFATQALLKKQLPLSVCFNAAKTSYRLISGLSSEGQGEEIFVSKVTHVLDDDKNLLGTICRANSSQKYYWLPMKEMAWCNIEAELADFVFYSSVKNIIDAKVIPIKVKLCDTPSGNYISKIKTIELFNSFRKKRCGSDNIEVYVVTEPSLSENANFTFKAYSILHKVLLNCVLFDGSLMPEVNDIVKTEVIEKDFADLKIKSLFGVRKVLAHLPIYKRSSGEQVPISLLNSSIAHIYGYDDAELQANFETIKKIQHEIEESGYNELSLISGFIMLERLTRLQQLNRPVLKSGSLVSFFELLLLNLLRHICIEALNNAELDWLQDHYLDFVLADLLKPFYAADNVYLSEAELNKLRKIANIFCFQLHDRRYPIIGNSILQALGFKANLDKLTVNESKLFKIYKLMAVFPSADLKTRLQERGFMTALKKAIEILEVNQFKFNLLFEKLIKDQSTQ